MAAPSRLEDAATDAVGVARVVSSDAAIEERRPDGPGHKPLGPWKSGPRGARDGRGDRRADGRRGFAHVALALRVVRPHDQRT